MKTRSTWLEQEEQIVLTIHAPAVVRRRWSAVELGIKLCTQTAEDDSVRINEDLTACSLPAAAFPSTREESSGFRRNVNKGRPKKPNQFCLI